MKIAWFTHRYAPCIGGAENFGRAIVRRFVEAGDRVDVFTSDAFDLWYFNDRRRTRVDRPLIEWIDGARVQRFGVRHIPAQRYVGRLLSHVPHWPTQCTRASFMPILPGIDRVRGDYDAAVAVGFPYTIFAYAAWKTARKANAPLILVPFLHLSTPGDVVNRHYTRPHQVRLLREADLVVVQTDIEAQAVASWNIPDARILKLGMAVDQAEVTGGDRAGFRRRLGIPEGRPVVGQLGANDPNKGTCDLVRAVERINATRPVDQPVHLLLAGATSPDFERFLATVSDDSRRWLTVLGLLPEPDRASFYAALDVFAMPSRTDSFGIVYLEAWANGLPVVAAAAGGVAEVVRDGRDGVLIPFGDVEALAGVFTRLIDGEPALARTLGDEGRRRVSAEGYTWPSRFDAFASRLRALASDRRTLTGDSIYRPHTGMQGSPLTDDLRPGPPASLRGGGH